MKLMLRDPAASPREKPPKPEFLASLRELTELRGFAALTAIFSTTSIANWIVYAWLPLYLYERFGMSLAAAGFAATFYIQAGSVAGILLGGRLADRPVLRARRGRLYTPSAGPAAG